MKNLWLIGGTMGVGKTAVCRQLKKELPHSVFLDGDWCWDASPFQVTKETKAMVLDNICHILNNFLRCSAYENVIFCWVMHEQSIIDGILSRLDTTGSTVHAISLIADAPAVRDRLAGDISRGLRSADVVERSLARLPLYEQLGTIKIDTTRQSVQDTAAQIKAFCCKGTDT